MPTTATWSNSRPLVPCAVASTRCPGASRSSVARLAGARDGRPQRIERGERRGPAEQDLPGVAVRVRRRDPQQERVGVAAISGDPLQQRIDGRVVEAQPILLDAERDAQLHGHGRERRQLPVGAGEDRVAAGIAAVPRAEQPTGTRHVIARVGRQDQGAGAAGSGIDALDEPFRDVLHQPRRSTDHLRRTAVVGGQVDPS